MQIYSTISANFHYLLVASAEAAQTKLIRRTINPTCINDMHLLLCSYVPLIDVVVVVQKFTSTSRHETLEEIWKLQL